MFVTTTGVISLKIGRKFSLGVAIGYSDRQTGVDSCVRRTRLVAAVGLLDHARYPTLNKLAAVHGS